MSDELRGVVVCHGKLAGALVEAAEPISGVTGALVPVSQHRLRPRRARGAGRSPRSTAGPAVVFVDMASGSCLFAVLQRLRDTDGVKVVTGVNLAMLVDFVFHRSLAAGRGRRPRAVAAGSPRDQGALMAIVLFRVDDRLIHGQVVIGWGRPLGVTRIVLVDDQVAGERLGAGSLPHGRPARHRGRASSTVAEGGGPARRMAGATAAGRSCSPAISATMAALHAAAPAIVQHVNLGGVHHRPGRRERLPYLYLTDEELRALVALEQAGADVTAQDLPTTSAGAR